MGENIVDVYREAAISDSVAFTEFILSYKKNKDSIYCFYEGQEDFAYYPIRVKSISCIVRYLDFNCGGKESVLKVRDLIKSNEFYKDAKTGFFIDKDFDDYNLPNDVYITPSYSIENLYANDEVIENILISEFKFKRNTADFQKCISTFKMLQTSFCTETKTFNAWLSCQADIRNNGNISTRLKIDAKIKDLFEKVVLPDLSGHKDLSDIANKDKIQNIYTHSPIITNEMLNERIAEFDLVKQNEVFRGKFLLKHLISFLSRLQSIFGTATTPFEEKYSCNLRFEAATGCSTLSQYAITPSCLKSYIITHLN